MKAIAFISVAVLGLLAGIGVAELEVQAPSHCGHDKPLNLENALLYKFETRHNLTCNLSTGKEASFVTFKGEILTGGSPGPNNPVSFFKLSNVSIEYTDVQSGTKRDFPLSQRLESVVFVSHDAIGKIKLCFQETDRLWERNWKNRIISEMLGNNFDLSEDQYNGFSRLENIQLTHQLTGDSVEVVGMRVKALTPFMSESDVHIHLNSKEFSNVTSLYDSLRKRVSTEFGDYSEETWRKNLSGIDSRLVVELQGQSRTTALPGSAGKGFHLSELLDSNLQCEEKVDINFRFLKHIDLTVENALAEDIMEATLKTSTGNELHIAYYKNIIAILRTTNEQSKEYARLLEKGSGLAELSSEVLQTILDSLECDYYCGDRKLFMQILAKYPSEEGLVFSLKNHQMWSEEETISHLAKMIGGIAPSTEKFNNLLSTKTVDALTTFLETFVFIELDCYTESLPSEMEESPLITAIDSLLPLIPGTAKSFFAAYTKLRNSCNPKLESSVCHWPSEEYKDRLEGMEKDLLLVNLIKGIDCLDSVRKGELAKVLKETITDKDVVSFFHNFLANREKRDVQYESFQHILQREKYFAFLNGELGNSSLLGTSVLKQIPFSSFQFDMIYGIEGKSRLPRFVKIELDRLNYGVEILLLPTSENGHQDIELSLYKNRVPVWRIRYMDVREDVAFLQVVASSLMMKLQLSAYDKVENAQQLSSDILKQGFFKSWSFTEFDQTLQSFGLPLKSKSDLKAFLNLNISIPDDKDLKSENINLLLKPHLRIEKRHTVGYNFEANLLGGFQGISEMELSANIHLSLRKDKFIFYVQLDNEGSENIAEFKVSLRNVHRIQKLRDSRNPELDVVERRVLDGKESSIGSALSSYKRFGFATISKEVQDTPFLRKYSVGIPKILAVIEEARMTDSFRVSINTTTNEETREILNMSVDLTPEEKLLNLVTTVSGRKDFAKVGYKWTLEDKWVGALASLSSEGETPEWSGFEMIRKESRESTTTWGKVYVPSVFEISARTRTNLFLYEEKEIDGGKEYAFLTDFFPEVLNCQMNYTVQDTEKVFRRLKGHVSSSLAGANIKLVMDSKLRKEPTAVGKPSIQSENDISVRANNAYLLRYKGKLGLQPEEAADGTGLHYLMKYNGKSNLEELQYKADWTLPFSLEKDIEGSRIFWSESGSPAVFAISLQDPNFLFAVNINETQWTYALDINRTELNTMERTRIQYDMSQNPPILSGSTTERNMDDGAIVRTRDFIAYWKRMTLFNPLLEIGNVLFRPEVDAHFHLSHNQTTPEGTSTLEILRSPLRPYEAGEQERPTFSLLHTFNNENLTTLCIKEKWNYEDPREFSGAVEDYHTYNALLLLKSESTGLSTGRLGNALKLLNGRKMEFNFNESKIQNWDLAYGSDSEGYFETGTLYKFFLNIEEPAVLGETPLWKQMSLRIKNLLQGQGTYSGEKLPDLQDMDFSDYHIASQYSAELTSDNGLNLRTRLLSNIPNGWADLSGQFDIPKENGKTEKTLDVHLRLPGVQPRQFDRMDRSKINPAFLTDGKIVTLFFFSNTSLEGAASVKAKQHVLRHYFANWRNLEVFSSETVYSADNKHERYSLVRLLSPVNGPGQDVIVKATGIFTLEGRSRPHLDIEQGRFGTLEAQFLIFPEVAKTNISFAALANKKEAEDGSGGIVKKRKFELQLESRILPFLGYGENMSILYTQEGNDGKYWKRQKSFEFQSDLYFHFPNGHSGNLSSTTKGKLSEDSSFISNDVKFVGRKRGSVRRKMIYRSVAALLVDNEANTTVLSHYDNSASVKRGDQSPVLAYSYASTFTQKPNEVQLSRLIGNLETWEGSTKWKSNLDTSLRYFLGPPEVSLSKEVDAGVTCEDRKASFLSSYLEDGLEITKETTQKFRNAQLQCGEGNCHKIKGFILPAVCEKKMKAHLVAKGEFRYRDGNELDLETFWEDGGKCYSPEGEKPVCSKLSVLLFPPEWYQATGDEEIQSPSGDVKMYDLVHPLKRVEKNDWIMVPFTIFWGYVA